MTVLLSPSAEPPPPSPPPAVRATTSSFAAPFTLSPVRPPSAPLNSYCPFSHFYSTLNHGHLHRMRDFYPRISGCSPARWKRDPVNLGPTVPSSDFDLRHRGRYECLRTRTTSRILVRGGSEPLRSIQGMNPSPSMLSSEYLHSFFFDLKNTPTPNIHFSQIEGNGAKII